MSSIPQFSNVHEYSWENGQAIDITKHSAVGDSVVTLRVTTKTPQKVRLVYIAVDRICFSVKFMQYPEQVFYQQSKLLTKGWYLFISVSCRNMRKVNEEKLSRNHVQ